MRVLVAILLLCCVAYAEEVTTRKTVDTNQMDKIYTTVTLAPAAEVSLMVQVIYGDSIEIYTLDQANYDRYRSTNGAKLVCNGLVAGGNISYVPELSVNTTTQGFAVKELRWPVAYKDQTLYLTAGYRDSHCICPSCSKKAEVQIRVNLPSLSENKIVQTILVVASILTAWLVLWVIMRLYKRWSDRKRMLQMEMEELEIERMHDVREKERMDKAKLASEGEGVVGSIPHSRRRKEEGVPFDDA